MSPTLPPPQICTSPVTYSSLPDGSYQFAVRAQGETIATTQNFIKVTQPPTLAWTSTSPASSTPNATALFQFQGQAALAGVAVNFSCQLSVAGADALQGTVYEGTVNAQPVCGIITWLRRLPGQPWLACLAHAAAFQQLAGLT